jgi:hypothetical protein
MQKRPGGVTQAVEFLPSKREALSSNSNAVKKVPFKLCTNSVLLRDFLF